MVSHYRIELPSLSSFNFSIIATRASQMDLDWTDESTSRQIVPREETKESKAAVIKRDDQWRQKQHFNEGEKTTWKWPMPNIRFMRWIVVVFNQIHLIGRASETLITILKVRYLIINNMYIKNSLINLKHGDSHYKRGNFKWKPWLFLSETKVSESYRPKRPGSYSFPSVIRIWCWVSAFI